MAQTIEQLIIDNQLLTAEVNAQKQLVIRIKDVIYKWDLEEEFEDIFPISPNSTGFEQTTYTTL